MGEFGGFRGPTQTSREPSQPPTSPDLGTASSLMHLTGLVWGVDMVLRYLARACGPDFRPQLANRPPTRTGRLEEKYRTSVVFGSKRGPVPVHVPLFDSVSHVLMVSAHISHVPVVGLLRNNENRETCRHWHDREARVRKSGVKS